MDNQHVLIILVFIFNITSNRLDLKSQTRSHTRQHVAYMYMYMYVLMLSYYKNTNYKQFLVSDKLTITVDKQNTGLFIDTKDYLSCT